MTDYRDQAIRDVAEAFDLSTNYVTHCLTDPYGRDDDRIAYAVSRQERVLGLEARLQQKEGATNEKNR